MSSNIKEKRKNEIMDIASDLFYSKGIADTTISEITYLANIGKGTFYEYFKNKDDVINEYIKNHFQNTHTKILEEIEKYKTNKEKILFIVSFLSNLKICEEKFTYIFIEFLRLSCNKKKEESESFHTFNEQNLNLLIQYLKEGIKQKEFKVCNAQNLAFEIVSSLLGNIILSLSHEIKECDNSTKSNIETLLKSIEYKEGYD